MSELGARASGQGRVFQTSRDQYIQEHHHHYGAGADGPLFDGDPPAGFPRQAAPAAPDAVRVPLVGRPPGVLRNREELRETLTEAVAGPGGEVHVVHGMGGCGKTALAYWLFTEAVRAHGRVGFWVNASERMSLRAGMLAVAGDRGATAGELAAAAAGQRAAADLVWHWLDHCVEPWLLVLDNADDPSVLADGAWLRTSGQGTVLVTTRHATAALWRGPAMTRHGLGVLPLDDAAQVLCDLAPDAGDLDSARKVARRLGRLPLALTSPDPISPTSYRSRGPWTSTTASSPRGRRASSTGAPSATAAASPAISSAAPGSCPWTPSPRRVCRRRRPCYGCCRSWRPIRCR
ncbi:NB-ARC domain-containing protein [Streptomyces adelaidensis]|uniref:NB-ARC domain-containing protein n=1 Tax=Streptomyces adelaidensis TaxID=2796465 RepID=UPI0027DB7887|nr:NB-ARC domain-containing protein [Streptomyces adelaidensis]